MIAILLGMLAIVIGVVIGIAPTSGLWTLLKYIFCIGISGGGLIAFGAGVFSLRK